MLQTFCTIHYLVPHLLSPALQVVLVPREAVYQEVVLLALGHGSLQERTGDLHRDYGAISNVVLYQLSKLKCATSSITSITCAINKFNYISAFSYFTRS